MKSIVYIIASVFPYLPLSRSLSSSMEDDIYYVPGAKPLIVKEVETETGQHIDMTKISRYDILHSTGIRLDRQYGIRHQPPQRYRRTSQYGRSGLSGRITIVICE